MTGSMGDRSAGELLDVEGYPRAPSNLNLQQVHLYVRHGERTPVKTRMAEPPASIPEYWPICSAARQFRGAVLTPPGPGFPGEMESRSGEGAWFIRGTEMRDGRMASNVCLLGSLTDVGKESTYNFGVALRRLYIDRLGFLPGTLQSEKQVYFRSTDIPRTIQSLQHIVSGLYPKVHCATSVIPIILVRNKAEENLNNNVLSCQKLDLLRKRFAEAAATKWNPRLQVLDEKLSKYIKGRPVRIDGSPRASGILDTVLSAVAHSVKIPEEFQDPDVMGLIQSAVSDEWFSVKSEQGRRLGMGRLLADMSTKMDTKVEREDDDPLKILVHSVHDGTLAALCSTFDVFDDRWPPFTSSVTFELFKKRQVEQGSSLRSLFRGPWSAHSEEEHYIRMRYKNRNMILPMCAREGDHLPGSPEFCALGVFRRRVKELTPVDWNAECALDS